jgi:hypothetical protein
LGRVLVVMGCLFERGWTLGLAALEAFGLLLPCWQASLRIHFVLHPPAVGYGGILLHDSAGNQWKAILRLYLALNPCSAGLPYSDTYGSAELTAIVSTVLGMERLVTNSSGRGRLFPGWLSTIRPLAWSLDQF